MSQDSNGKGATVSNPLLGTVRASEGPSGMRLEAPNTTFEGLAQLLTELMQPAGGGLNQDGREEGAIKWFWNSC